MQLEKTKILTSLVVSFEGLLVLQRTHDLRGELILLHLVRELRPLSVDVGDVVDGVHSQHSTQCTLDQVQRAVRFRALRLKMGLWEH